MKSKNQKPAIVTKPTGKVGGTNKPLKVLTKATPANKKLNASVVVKPTKKG